MDLTARLVQGLEEPEPLDMVHVEMREEKIDSPSAATLPNTQALDASPRVQDQQRVLLGAHLDTGCVATVSDGLGPWGGE